MLPAPTEFLRIPSEDVEGIHCQLVSVYRSVFTRPPYNEGEEDIEAFEGKLERHSVRDGFRLFAAYEDDEIIGFSYGFAGGEDGWTRGIIESLLTEEEVERWLSDYFEFVELAVSPGVRGRGIGGRLHDELLSDVEHRTAMLFVNEEAEPALNLYRERGWRLLVEDLRFAGVEHFVFVMGRDLSAT